MIALVPKEQPEATLALYLLPFPRYSSISGFWCKLETEVAKSKKSFSLLALVLTEQLEDRLPFYLLPFPRHSSISGFCCNPKIEPLWVLEEKNLIRSLVPSTHSICVPNIRALRQLSSF